LSRGERTELQGALTLSNNAEGYLTVYFEVANVNNISIELNSIKQSL
jgi:hypothetical protein